MATAVTYGGGRQLKTFAGKDEFQASQRVFDELGLPEVCTSKGDVEKIEKLLGVASGTFDGYDFKMKASANSDCKGCGRQMNWLDVCHTALQVPGHSPQFIMETFNGAHGLVLAPPFRHLTCVNCNTMQDCKKEHVVRGYNCKGYMCQGG